MPLVAEVIDAVIGGDTHRDTHALEMTAPTGATMSTIAIDNDEGGFADALAWIAEHTPGSRVVVGLEGTRSYGIGLARAVRDAGLVVVEVERPRRPDRRRGKSDPIDALLLPYTCCVWTQTSCPPREPMATAKGYGSCWEPAASSPWSGRCRSTGSEHCC